MFELQNGSLVKHATLGVGKVVAVEALAVHVFFPDGEGRQAAKLRLPGARALLRTEGIEADGWLQGLSTFALDAKLGRYVLASTWVTPAQAQAAFLETYPAAFADPAYLEPGKGRGARWQAAQAAFQKTLGGGALQKLVEEGDVAGFVKRAVDLDRKVARLHPPHDVDALEGALSDESASRALLLALADLLSVPSPGRARFDRLFAAARGLPAGPEHQWLAATLLPFLAFPERHALVRPRVTFVAAERLGFDVHPDPAPTWSGYAAVREFEDRLLALLAPHGAKDLVDLEAFLQVIASGRKVAARPTAAPKGKGRRAT